MIKWFLCTTIHAVEILLPYTTAEDRVSLYIVIYCTPELFNQSALNSFTRCSSRAKTPLNPLKFFMVTNTK